MNVTVEHKPKYLSPSALISSKNPHTFYLERLCDVRLPREPQGKAAAMGSAFDTVVKKRLLNDGVGENRETFIREEIAKAVELSDFKEQAMAEAMIMGRKYALSAMQDTDFRDIEIHKKMHFDPLRTGGLPIFCKLDASYYDKDMDMIGPFDWKCSGLNPDNAKPNVSPKPGYVLQHSGKQVSKFAHKKYYKDMPFEQINKDWAVQTCTYGWALGLSPKLDKPFPVKIDMITMNSKREYLFTHYRGIITVEFQKEVFNRYMNLWNSIISGSFINRLEHKVYKSQIYILSTYESWF